MEEENVEKRDDKPHRKQKRKIGISIKFTIMVIMPLLTFGIVVLIVCMNKFQNTMYGEVESSMKNVASSLADAFDIMYPGDYEAHGTEQIAIAKGEKVLNGDFEFIDRIKSGTDCDITLFFANTRVLTTITDENGERIVGSTARNIIIREVVEEGKSRFYTNARIDGREYFAYYEPLKNSGGEVVGMVAVAMPEKHVNQKVKDSVLPIIDWVLIAMLLAGLLSMYYSHGFVRIIKKLKDCLEHTAKGEFAYPISEQILSRNDEFGEIFASTVEMQRELQTLVEKDALTGINNRRYGDKYLNKIWQENYVTGVPYAVAICDIDHFKKVNDQYGHEAGDEVLVCVAKLLKKHMTGSGFACRWGGEEFLLVFDIAGEQDAVMRINRLLEDIRKSEVHYEDFVINVTMTVGMVLGNHDIPVYKLVKMADEKLYEGKQGGRDRLVYEL